MVNPFMAKKSWSFLKHIQAQINKTSFEKFILFDIGIYFYFLGDGFFIFQPQPKSKIATHIFKKFKAYN